MKNLAKNRKARHDYQVLETFEAGLALQGTEVKSCREGNISLVDAYAQVKDGELWLVNAHTAPYGHGNRYNHDPKRDRKLLMHKREIRRIAQATEAKGLTVIPLRFYLSRGRIKVELGLCKGKNVHDKRQTLKRKIADRESREAMKRF